MPKPHSLTDMIIHAIRHQSVTNENGVSRAAIVKYLKAELGYDQPARLKQAFKRAVQSKKIVQTGQSFRVVGDPVDLPPPKENVTIEDVKNGTGNAAELGDTVNVKYEGVLPAENDAVFDSASCFEFQLGAGDVIKGWDLGIVGMKVGGVRKLFVPAHLGYGKRGSAPTIPSNADLLFSITLNKIKR